jgi:hypothetical protein
LTQPIQLLLLNDSLLPITRDYGNQVVVEAGKVIRLSLHHAGLGGLLEHLGLFLCLGLLRSLSIAFAAVVLSRFDKGLVFDLRVDDLLEIERQTTDVDQMVLCGFVLDDGFVGDGVVFFGLNGWVFALPFI